MIFQVTCCTVNETERKEVEVLINQKIETDDHGVQVDTEFDVELPDDQAAFHLANSHPAIIKVNLKK